MTVPKRVLYAEDDKSFREIFCRTAEQQGMPYTLVADATAGLKLIEAGEKFDLIVSDYQMPDLSGVEFLKLVRQHQGSESIPFVVYSTDDSWALRLEVNQYDGVFESKAKMSVHRLLTKYAG